jgi:putative acetyltransferase
MSQVLLREGFHERDRERIVSLLREYEAGIGISLCFQNFEAELSGLPGDYAPPGGTMLLADDSASGTLLGCVALRAVRNAPPVCEMKRLYVRPAARGSGLGRKLALAAMSLAGRQGYTRMCLDTLPTMIAAQELYRALGFRQTGISETEPAVLLFERDLHKDP